MVILCAMVSSSVVAGRGNALSKVIALRLCVITSQPFPIDLIKAVGLQNSSTDYACSCRSFHDVVDVSEHDVPIGGDGGSIAVLGYCEGRAVRGVADSTRGREFVRGGAGGKVDIDTSTQRRICGTSTCILSVRVLYGESIDVPCCMGLHVEYVCAVMGASKVLKVNVARSEPAIVEYILYRTKR